MHVGIIGGGMMGLATAVYLTKAGIKVTIIEKENEIGGLSRPEELIPGTIWDRFYHVILSTDQDLLDFIDEIGLSLDVRFTETNTGFFTDGRLHSMSNVFEFLRFKPLSFWSKFRLGIGILYSSKIHNSSKLEKTYAKNWLIQVFGRRNYEKLWDPLLRSKLGSAKKEASASFIWSAISRYYGTREKGSSKEMMGIVRQGYFSILANIKKKLEDSGCEIWLNKQVKRIQGNNDDTISVNCNDNENITFDRVIATIPNAEYLKLLPHMPEQDRKKLDGVRYLSLVCVTLLLERSLCPFYIINITDEGFPFTGVIEATNIVPAEVLNEKALIYLPRYMPPDDSFYQKSDKEILDIFIEALRRIFPDLSDEEIIVAKVNRERNVQPIQRIEYASNIPSIKTFIENLYLVNTSMIVNSTLNNNQVIQLARKMSDLMIYDDKPV